MAVSKFPLAFFVGPLVKKINFKTYETVAIMFMLATMIHQYF